MTPNFQAPTTSSHSKARADFDGVGAAVFSLLRKSAGDVGRLKADADTAWYRVTLAENSAVLVRMCTNEPSANHVVERFTREYELLSGMDCPAVVHPLGIYRDQGRAALILTDPGGAFLDTSLPDSGRPRNLIKVLEAACRLASSIHQIHERGLFHGDIRPSNCIFDKSGDVRLTGFGLAGQLIPDANDPPAIDVIAATLAYMSPEQTGKMNRSLDMRSDLYAFGVTLFELFTGGLPFEAGDALEWAHRHLASQPPRPSDRNPIIFPQIDAIILKLLKKNPDDRYQTARAVENDLLRCLTDFSATETVEHFQPARSDLLNLQQNAPALFGRDDARQRLINAVDRVVASGESEFVLVSGPAGVGKSSLVEDLFSSLDGRRLLLASGKFDQHKWETPYATLAQAFTVLVRQILAKDESELAEWRQALSNALGGNAQLIIDLIPELVHVIGPQPATAPADLATAQVRFHFVFRAFINVFATTQHPLVLFIDDLQWLDTATLDLIQRLTSDPERRPVLIIGAYRDEDVGQSDMLASVLANLRSLRGRTEEIRLPPLRREDLLGLLANLLSTSPERVRTVANLIYEKTGGNPFFAIRFVRQLAADGSLFFQPNSSEWDWSPSAIREKRLTENVGQLLSLQLDRLPAATRHALGKLSLLGNITDARTAAFVLQAPDGDLRDLLDPAIDAGLVKLANNTLSFAHDHVQAAAYSSIDLESRTRDHLDIGRLLVAHIAEHELEERIFEITSQFDRGSPIVSPTEAATVAKLYLLAGERAKAASAYATAKTYFERGRALVTGRWQDQYQLLFQLELNQLESEIVIGDLAGAETRLSGLTSAARGFADRAKVVCLAVLLYFTTGRSSRAVDIGVEFLREADLGWPESPTEADVRREFDNMHLLLSDTPIDNLAHIIEMIDPQIISAISVMTEVFPAAYAVDRRLMEFLPLRMTNLSLKHGYCESSAVAYSALNMALGAQFDDYKTAYAFGELARRLVDQSRSGRYKARVYSLFAGFTTPWIRPLVECAPLMAEAFRISCSTGDMAFAAYNTRNRITHEFMSGKPLQHVQREVEHAVDFADKVQLGLPTERFFGQLRLVRKLRGTDAATFSDDDGWALRETDPQPGVAMMISYHWVFRLIEHYLTEDYVAAQLAASRVETIRWAMRSSIEEAEYVFYAGLTSAALAEHHAAEKRRFHLDALCNHHDRMSAWAENCPANFGCREALLGAERARLEGKESLAQSLYETSIQRARSGGFIQVEAISAELAGRFYASKGLGVPSDAYLRTSREAYNQWGCLTKVRLLDFRYLHLSERLPSSFPSRTIEMPVASLDVETVGRASRVLSSEMVLSKLIEKLMHLSIQHAGAERGALLLFNNGELNIEATAVTENGQVLVTLERRQHTVSELPSSVLKYVLRTRTPAVLDDLAPGAFDASDPYFRDHRPRSILCVPIFNATDVIGLLYIENGLAPGVFSPDRIAVLDFLASQAGIWLSNSRLYSDLQRSEAWLKEAQRLSRTGSFYWHDDLDALECSEEIYRIFEYPPELPITISVIRARVHPSDRQVFTDLVEKARQSGRDVDRQFRLQFDGGIVKEVRLVTRSGIDLAGKRRHLGSLQDVSEMQQAQDALSNVRSELAHVSRTATLGVLTASIAHEVSQPLLGIVANAETCQIMLETDPPNIEGAIRTAQRCLRDGYRAAETIKRLRNLFGSKNATVEQININEIVREVLTLAANELQMNDVIVQTDFAQVLPLASGDRVQVQQVVLNLLLNAMDAMRTISATPKAIQIRTRISQPNEVRVDISDCGIGFDPALAEKLFEAFYTTKADGMGVGLSVSQAIIESLQGRLWASGNDKQGATFTFTLQRVPEQTANSALKTDKARGASPGSA
ncbi:trifunctional serine/threonine-protein kinase/ATP-binding protein/sensor histidine kinase [Pararhizobium sp. O133]|uniref:trifunctional serine/threonine-protein kinase/ATP-binding protein/sensor histidine kinase n=1 Tax=Pararhizobium sp. O133 TaxID=3449278 RepID=UPI003F6845BF